MRQYVLIFEDEDQDVIESVLDDFQDYNCVRSITPMETIRTDEGAVFTTWVSPDGYTAGYKCEAEGLPTRYLYLNASSGNDEEGRTPADSANAFVYLGEAGDPAEDSAYAHYMIWDDLVPAE